MKLKELYKIAYQAGMKADPRGENEMRKRLDKQAEKYAKLDEKGKSRFDVEELENPYADTRIIFGDIDKEIKTVLVGIDVDAPEIILADRLREKGMEIDLVITHHPVARALADLHKVMDVQDEYLSWFGVPINVAEALMSKRRGEVERGLMPTNHFREYDAARLLDVPLMTMHTPADNHVHGFLTDLFAEKKPESVGEIIDILEEIDEYRYFAERGLGPKQIAGKKDNRCGKIMLGMTGGTGGSKEVFQYASNQGVGTMVDMHLREEHLKEAEKHYMNVVIAGHMPSDALGMNLLLDQIEAQGVKIIPFSGFYRRSRAHD